jgi:phage FluMu protein Com
MEDSLFKEHRCKHCNKLLFKGAIGYGTVEIKCKHCKNINLFEGEKCKLWLLMDEQCSYKKSNGVVSTPATFVNNIINKCDECGQRNNCEHFQLIKKENTCPFCKNKIPVQREES